jgi:hypothetical protein
MLALLTAKRVQSFASIREEEAWNLVQSIKSLSQPHGHVTTINLRELVFNMVNNITSRVALGKNYSKHQQEFASLIKEMNMLATGFDLPDLFPSFKFLRYVTSNKVAIEKIQEKMDKNILDQIINDHKLKRNNTIAAGEDHLEKDADLVDVLLQFQESGDLHFDLTTDNIKAVTLVYIIN